MKFLRDDKGLTLTELLVVVALMPIIIGVVYFVMNAVSSMADGNIARAAAMGEAQRFVVRVGRELRQAREEGFEGNNVALHKAFKVIQPRECEFYSDINGDGARDRIRYWYDASDEAVYRTQALATDANGIEPNFGATSPPMKLITKVDPEWIAAGEPIFKYLDNNPETDDEVTPPSIDKVSLVKVQIKAYAKSGSRESGNAGVAEISAKLRSVNRDF